MEHVNETHTNHVLNQSTHVWVSPSFVFSDASSFVFRDASSPVGCARRDGRSRVVKACATVNKKIPAARTVRTRLCWSTSPWAIHTDPAAMSLRVSNVRQTIGMITSQFKIKLRMMIDTAAQLSAEVMPSVGVR